MSLLLCLFLATDMGIARSEFLEDPGTITPLPSRIVFENSTIIFTQIKYTLLGNIMACFIMTREIMGGELKNSHFSGHNFTFDFCFAKFFP